MKPLKKLEMPESTIKSMDDLNKATWKATMALEELIKDIERIKNDQGRTLHISVSPYPLSSAFLDYVSAVRNELSHRIAAGAFVEKE